MASIIKGQSGQPIQFETTPNVNGDNVATEEFALSNDLGVGQTWQNFLGSRSVGVTYTNNTGKPIVVSITSLIQEGSPPSDLSVDNLVVASTVLSQSGVVVVRSPLSAIVPQGSTYRLDGGFGIIMWAELR